MSCYEQRPRFFLKSMYVLFSLPVSDGFVKYTFQFSYGKPRFRDAQFSARDSCRIIASKITEFFFRFIDFALRRPYRIARLRAYFFPGFNRIPVSSRCSISRGGVAVDATAKRAFRPKAFATLSASRMVGNTRACPCCKTNSPPFQ